MLAQERPADAAVLEFGGVSDERVFAYRNGVLCWRQCWIDDRRLPSNEAKRVSSQ